MKFILTAIFICIGSSIALSQTIPELSKSCKQHGGDKDCVLVPQEFIDDANLAFQIKLSDDATIAKFLTERAAKDDVIEKQDKRIAGLMELLIDYAEADSLKKKKSIWKKIGNFIKSTFKELLKPENIRRTIDLIALIRIIEKL